MIVRNIEKFFLNTLLRISILGVSFILLSSIVFRPESMLPTIVSLIILLACIAAYKLRDKYPTQAVLLLTSTTLLVVAYQRITAPHATIALAVVMIVGFIISVMLKGRTMWVMHGITFILLNTVFVFHVSEKVTACITFSILYFIITFATAVLKGSYDGIHYHLRHVNLELKRRADEIDAQNKELHATQAELSSLNQNLEKIVSERTARIKSQNEMLIRYGHINAHHLRGPVARLLGLAAVYKMGSDMQADELVDKMIEQANEIDAVIKRINADLDSNNMGWESEN
jgi:signal transduction histidine kinase